MTTSGTTSFAPNFLEIAEDAFERAGREMRTGYDLRTARRSLNLLTIEWTNQGLNFWVIEQGTVPLVAGTATYTLPADTIDILEHVVRIYPDNTQLQTDFNLTRISASTYANIPNKLTQAQPLQIVVNRLRDAPTVTLWPVPDNVQSYTLAYWRMRRIQDAGSGVETPDIPFRFYPALIAGLAYYIAMKIPEGSDRLIMLKQEYDRQWDLAAGEDRERASQRWVPRRQFVGSS